ncbi:MAG: restriction endonuclease [Zestosphaera sp.]
MGGQQPLAWIALMRQILSSESKCIDRELITKHVEVLDLISLEGTYAGIAGELCFKSLLPLALKALEGGADLYEVSSLLNWKDFEELVSEYLRLSGYESIRNLRTKLRKYEYDVVAVDPVSRAGLIIDCKHWSPGYSKKGKLKYVAGEHKQKCLYLVKQCQQIKNEFRLISKAKWFVPVIVTLTEVLRGNLEGVLVVPIRTFRDFLVNLEFYTDLMKTREYSLKIVNECYTV